jgi:hypothetical protein
MSFGFVIVRHVNSKQTDYYWKECYTCIRRWYSEPILIVDDSSDRAYLNDNMALVATQIVYDTELKGCGEFLGYYHFHRLRPFETAVILHDSVFIQKRIAFSVPKTMQFLWTIPSCYDRELESYYYELCHDMPTYTDFTHVYGQGAYKGCFGVMSVITWDFLALLVEDGFFMTRDEIKRRRDARSALERIIGIMAFRRDPTIPVMFGEIGAYTRLGTTFLEYLRDGSNLEMVKVWTGR